MLLVCHLVNSSRLTKSKSQVHWPESVVWTIDSKIQPLELICQRPSQLDWGTVYVCLSVFFEMLLDNNAISPHVLNGKFRQMVILGWFLIMFSQPILNVNQTCMFSGPYGGLTLYVVCLLLLTY